MPRLNVRQVESRSNKDTATEGRKGERAVIEVDKVRNYVRWHRVRNFYSHSNSVAGEEGKTP